VNQLTVSVVFQPFFFTTPYCGINWSQQYQPPINSCL